MNFSREAVSKTVNFILVAIIWLAIGWILRSQFVPQENLLVHDVRQLLERDFPGELPNDEALTVAAAQGLLTALDDPYAVIIPPPISQKFNDDFAGETGIVGIVPGLNDSGQMIVDTIIEGSTSEIAGVEVGDILLEIDGIPVDASTTLTGSALYFRGPVGEPVDLLIQRGDQLLTFSPERTERVALEWEILDDGVGYIAQYTFTTNVPELFEEALTTIMATNPPAIIWDVRFNGGGSMQVAQEVLSFFVAEGPLFQVMLKGNEAEVFSSSGEPIAPSVPLYVLVNEFTFSAAETVASSIQELERGMTVGSTTFGKGSVQNAVPLRGDYLFEYTIGYWQTPAGGAYEGVGFTPEIVAPDDPNTAVDETVEAVRQLISGD